MTITRYFILLILISCAVVETPSGGPIDEIPPQIVSLSPADSSRNIKPKEPIVIAFSERVDTAYIKSAVKIYPQGIRLKYKWDWLFKDLTIIPKDSWPEDVTITIVIGPHLKDYHKVIADTSLTLHITRSNVLDEGYIEINLNTVYEDTLVPYFAVNLYKPGNDTTDVLERVADFRAYSNYPEKVEFTHLPDWLGKWEYLGYFDLDKNLSWDMKTESAVYDSIDIAVHDFMVNINCTLNVSSIEGYVETPDTGQYLIELLKWGEGTKPTTEKPDSLGYFKFSPLSPGAYIISKLTDLDIDGRADTLQPEPILTDTLQVGIGKKVIIEKLKHIILPDSGQSN